MKGLKKYFDVTHGFSFGKEKQYVRAVDGVVCHPPGETLGLVGKSGCGKSTTGNCIIRLLDPSGGEVLFEGKDISKMSPKELKPLRRDIQMIFQDPYLRWTPACACSTSLPSRSAPTSTSAMKSCTRRFAA